MKNTEKYSRGVQQQTWGSRGKDQRNQRQGDGTQTEQQKEKNVLNEDSLRTYGEHQADQYSGVLEGQDRERKKRAENLFEEIMAQNFPNLWK